MKTIKTKPIPLSELNDHLDPYDVTIALALAMEETALVQALVMIHGKDHGYKLYVERGGRLRYDGEEVYVLWADDLRSRKSIF